MARIINTSTVSLQEKYSVIKPLVKWGFFKRKSPFKNLKNLSSQNQLKIHNIYTEVIIETGQNYKFFKPTKRQKYVVTKRKYFTRKGKRKYKTLKITKYKTVFDKKKAQSAIEKYNPELASSGWVKYPFVNGTHNQKTKLKFKKGTPYLFNETAQAETDIYRFGPKEMKGDFSESLEWVKMEMMKEGEKRGKIITASGGDIFQSEKVGGRNFDPADIEGYYQKLRALYDRYPNAGSWIDSLQIVRFKKPKEAKKGRKKNVKTSRKRRRKKKMDKKQTHKKNSRVRLRNRSV